MNIRRNDTLIGAIVCLVIGVLWVSFAPVSLFALFVGLLLSLSFAAFLCLDWYKTRRSEDIRAEMYLDPYAPVNTMREYRNLPEQDKQSLLASRVVVKVIPNFDGPRVAWEFPLDELHGVHDDLIVRNIWAAASETAGMPPQHDYGEGTRERVCCKAMTDYFIRCGWCKPATSNKAAQFVPGRFQDASRSLWGDKP